MIELNLWRDGMGGDRRISIDPQEIVYYTAVEKEEGLGDGDHSA